MKKLDIKKILDELFVADLQVLASSMAFVTVLSVVPLFAIVLALFSTFGGIELFFTKFESQIVSFFAENISEAIVVNLNEFSANLKNTSIGMQGFVFFSITSMKLIRDIDSSVQKVWSLKNKRPLSRRILVYFTVLLLGPSLAIISFAVLTSNFFPILSVFGLKFSIFIIIFAALFLVYKYVPNCHVNTIWAFATAFVTSVMLFVSQKLYFYIIHNIVIYDKLYGALAFIPSFLIWI